MNNSNYLVIVDVQPNFQRNCHFILPEIIEKINSTNQEIICFYVGKVLEGDKKNDVIGYFMENGIDFDKLDKIKFVEKDFGFFRTWMDAGVSEDIMIKAINLLKESGFKSTSQFSQNDWNKVLTDQDKKSFYFYDEHLFYPTFNGKLFEKPGVNHMELIGGALHECLAEVDLYLKAMGKKTHINKDLCYGGKRDKILENQSKRTKIKM